MSDRTQGSVRTEPPAADPATADGSAAPAAQSVSATQAIPTTGSQRAQAPVQQPATGSTPAGVTAVAAAPPGTADAPPAGAPPVPPAAAADGTPSLGADTGRSAATATPPVEKAPRGRAPKGAGRGPRRARLQLRHIDTWSALKISLVLSIALFFIWMVAVGVLYGVLNALGVFDTLNDLFGQIGSASGAENTGDVVTPGVVFGGAAVIGAINIVLMTALCTVGTFIYNLCSDLVGGLELTLSERD